ncbi:MAG: D-alanine--D-alanine ligase [Oscillospiraceae bacterium]|nr:D-alanine--D-alanine ligase [Oscillospiraceae bacterium]
MKIVVLGGGISTERHVALVTATSVCRALRRLGHQAVFVDLFFGLENFQGTAEEAFLDPDGLCTEVKIEKQVPDLKTVWSQRKQKGKGHLGDRVAEVCSLADCVFLGLHGKDGEDGKIQALLELIGVAYTGSGPLASALAMNKAMAKRVLEGCGVRTPAWRELHYTEADIDRLSRELSVPCAVKVIDGGSSIGVRLPENREELRKALRDILEVGNHIIVEEKIRGREITVPVLDGKALSPIEIVPQSGMDFDYVAKYQSGKEGGAAEICPAVLAEEDETQLKAMAEKVQRELGLSVYSRSDFILDSDGKAWFLEVNTLPGMTPNSLIPKAAAVGGMSYDELCERIVMLSVKTDRE